MSWCIAWIPITLELLTINNETFSHNAAAEGDGSKDNVNVIQTLQIISTVNTNRNLNQTVLLGHEAEEHYHSLDFVATPSTEKGDVVEYMKNKYSEGKESNEICLKGKSPIQSP